MITAFRVALFIILLCLSAMGLLVAFPYLKEGSSFGDLPIMVGVVGAALLLGILWWLAVGRSVAKSLAGWAVLALPAIAHGSMAAGLLFARLHGPYLENEIRIERYAEEPLVWPGFDGPVGLRITLQISNPRGAKALIAPPEIRMGPAFPVPRDLLSVTMNSSSGYFKDSYLDRRVGSLALLRVARFQRLFENPAGTQPYQKWDASSTFDASGRTLLTYHLFPGTVEFLPARERICLVSTSAGIRLCGADENSESGCAPRGRTRVTDPIYADGRDLSALWPAFGSSDMVVDMSAALTAVLRAQSALQSDPAAWTAMQRRFEPTGLREAGYRLCPPGKDSHSSFRTCYCK